VERCRQLSCGGEGGRGGGGHGGGRGVGRGGGGVGEEGGDVERCRQLNCGGGGKGGRGMGEGRRVRVRVLEEKSLVTRTGSLTEIVLSFESWR
jgi:hypothetical protein